MSDQRSPIMIVGADDASTRVITNALVRLALPAPVAVHADELVPAYQANRPAAVVLDADAAGPGSLCGLRRLDRVVPVLIVSSEIATQAVIEAMGYGVWRVLRKPLAESEVAAALGQALDNHRVDAEIASLRTELQAAARHRVVAGSNARMAEVARLIDRAADTDATVLIEGESGTGKDLMARVIHDLSARRAGPFVKVNCSGLPDGPLESELFGFERGAFSGAMQHKPGKLDFAHHGTLFLDEVAALSPALQAKLLTVLGEGAFSRVGGLARLPVDARLVASSSVNLEAAVAAGTFREDLFFRLNEIGVVLPPLRERREDIVPLVKYFLRTFSVHCNTPCPPVANDTLRVMEEYAWPGNVRELQNAVRRLVLPGGEAELRRELQRATAAATWPAAVHPPAGRPDTAEVPGVEKPAAAAPALPRTLKEIARAAAQAAERAAIFRVLQRTRWNRKAAAEFLGISYKALLYKIRENGLDKPATS